MRICKVKATNKLIEMQSDAKEGTLLNNAARAGYNLNDIVELEITAEAFAGQYPPPAAPVDAYITLKEKVDLLQEALLTKKVLDAKDLEKPA